MVVANLHRTGISRTIHLVGQDIANIRNSVNGVNSLSQLFGLVARRGNQPCVMVTGTTVRIDTPLNTVRVRRCDHVFSLGIHNALFAIRNSLPLLASNTSVLLATSITTSAKGPTEDVCNTSGTTVQWFTESYTGSLGSHSVHIGTVDPNPARAYTFGSPGVLTGRVTRSRRPCNVSCSLKNLLSLEGSQERCYFSYRAAMISLLSQEYS